MLPQPYRSNCFYWAILQLRREGGYLVFRRSQISGWMPHIMWMPTDLSGVWGYTPVDPKTWKRQVIRNRGRFIGHIVRERGE